MNELLAIVLIVLLCCAMFFAWLFALATCPDRLVNLISGTKSRSNLSSSPMSRTSEDLGGGDRKGSSAGDSADGCGGGGGGAHAHAQSLIAAVVKRASPVSQRDTRPLLGRSRSIPANRSNGLLVSVQASQPQTAAQPLSADKRANSKKLSVVPEADEQLTVTSISQCGVRTPSSPKALEDALVVRTVMLARHHSDCGAKRVDEVDEEEEETSDGEQHKPAAAAKENQRATRWGDAEDKKDKGSIADDTVPPPPYGSEGDQPQISAEERIQLYNDGPTSVSHQQSFDGGDESQNFSKNTVTVARRSAPPAIHIV